jgi:hypothetical protein
MIERRQRRLDALSRDLERECAAVAATKKRIAMAQTELLSVIDNGMKLLVPREAIPA